MNDNKKETSIFRTLLIKLHEPAYEVMRHMYVSGLEVMTDCSRSTQLSSITGEIVSQF